MRELVIISGKGGTGKTSLTAAFATLADNMVLCDTDVDAADLHLLLAPVVRRETDFQGGRLAVIDGEKCVECGYCQEVCRFEAVRSVDEGFEIDPLGCEGCGVCVDLCPEQAIDFPLQTNGHWFISDTACGPMIHARLGIAEEQGRNLLLTDGPPGIGCPVIASVTGATAVVIVTEPTVSGLHDLERVAGLASHFKVPALVIINRYDLNPEQAGGIETLVRDRGMSLVGTIPFDPAFTEAMVQGKTLLEYAPDGEVAGRLREIWQRIMNSPAMQESKRDTQFQIKRLNQ